MLVDVGSETKYQSQPVISNHIIVMNPGDIDGRWPVGGSRRATARIHIEGMTCNKCVDFIQTKVSCEINFLNFPNLQRNIFK